MLKYLAAAIVLSNLIVSAFAAGLTDTAVHPRPVAPPTFDVTHKAVDPTFGTAILRVTGPVGSNAVSESALAIENMAPLQHFTIPWNSDGTRFLVWYDRTYKEMPQSRMRAYTFDPSNFSVTGYQDMKGLFGGGAGSEAMYLNYNRYITWSKSNPNLCYGITGVGNITLGSYDFTGEGAGSALSPQPNWLSLFGGYDLDAMMVSDDENVIGFTVTSASQVSKYYVVWMRDINAYATIDLTSATGGWVGTLPKPSAVWMSKDGRYVRIQGQQSGDATSGMYFYPVSKTGSTVTIGARVGYIGNDAAGYYSAGKWSSFQHYAVNEDSSGGEYRYRLRYRDLDNFTAQVPILQTTSHVFCHPAISPGGGYVGAGFIAYIPIDTWVLDGGSIYAHTYTASKPVSLDWLIYDRAGMNKVSSKGAMTAGTYYYDYAAGVVYLWTPLGVIPALYKTLGGDWETYSDEITTVRVDGLEVRRLAHAWNNFVDNAYDEIPTGISPNNRYIIFYSNWNGSGRHDVFILDSGFSSGKHYRRLRYADE